MNKHDMLLDGLRHFFHGFRREDCLIVCNRFIEEQNLEGAIQQIESVTEYNSAAKGHDDTFVKNNAIKDVLAERERQINGDGYSDTHDDDLGSFDFPFLFNPAMAHMIQNPIAIGGIRVVTLTTPTEEQRNLKEMFDNNHSSTNDALGLPPDGCVHLVDALSAEQWNECVPIGTPVRYFPHGNNTVYIDTETTSEGVATRDGVIVSIKAPGGGVALISIEYLQLFTEPK